MNRRALERHLRSYPITRTCSKTHEYQEGDRQRDLQDSWDSSPFKPVAEETGSLGAHSCLSGLKAYPRVTNRLESSRCSRGKGGFLSDRIHADQRHDSLGRTDI